MHTFLSKMEQIRGKGNYVMDSRDQWRTSLWQDLARDWNTLKSLHGKQRLLFVWDYYRWRILAVICAVIAVSLGVSILREGQKPCRLRVCVVLNRETDCRDWFSSFTEKLQSDGKPGTVDLNFDQLFDRNNSYYDLHQLQVMTTVSAGRMDAAVCGEDLYRYLLSLNACLPLDRGLTEDLYRSLENRGMLVYGTANLTADESGHVDPAEGIPGYYAVDLTGSEFYELYGRGGEGLEDQPLYAVIISNTEHPEDCQALIQALAER